MKKRTSRQYARALYEAIRGMPKQETGEIVNSFLVLLRKENKLKKIDYIIEEFIMYGKKQEGVKEMEIESARRLEYATVSRIKKIFGNKTEVNEKINKNLLGGVKIKIDDLIFDASLKTQLLKLKKCLI